MSHWGLVIYGVVTFFTAILSGVGGGGGGLIATPLAIFLGLTPQQAIATGKLNGLAISLGAIHGYRKSKLQNWRVILPIMAIASVIGITAPLLITKIDNDSYRYILGVILLLMIPVVLLKKIGHEAKVVSRRTKILGYVLVVVTLSMQAVFSSGMGVLVNLALMMCLGMTQLEASATKRYSQVVMNALIFIGVALSHLVVWQVAAVALMGSLVGGRIGAHLAIKKGNRFVSIIFAVLMLLSAVGLLFAD